MNVVILSPLQLELDACLEQFSDVSTISKGALSYPGLFIHKLIAPDLRQYDQYLRLFHSN
jgi:hypothetical protein